MRETTDWLVGGMKERGEDLVGMVWYIPRLSRPRGTSIPHTHTRTRTIPVPKTIQNPHKVTPQQQQQQQQQQKPQDITQPLTHTHTLNSLTRIPLPTGQRKANLVTGKNSQKEEEHAG